LNRAIQETEGLVLTYKGELIQASYFSTSNGYTEDSEAYWQDAIPYLRSVPSPWDVELSPKYKATKTFALEELKAKLELPASLGEADLAQVSILERTAGQRVKSVRIGGKVFTGREVRERLSLASSHFDWKWKNGKAVITTYGYGHGIGMSQYGAEGMAREGRSAEEILRYYYQGVEIKSMNNFVIPQV
jgi:stage II sporulation protein D